MVADIVILVVGIVLESSVVGNKSEALLATLQFAQTTASWAPKSPRVGRSGGAGSTCSAATRTPAFCATSASAPRRAATTERALACNFRVTVHGTRPAEPLPLSAGLLAIFV